MRRHGVLLTLAVLCALPAAPAAADEQVTARVGWSAPGSAREVTFPLTLERDAGDADAAWLTGFGFVGSAAQGTFGLTTSADGGGSYVVRVVGAGGSSAGRDAVCTTTDEAEDGTGTETCTVALRPQVGHAYELRAERQVTSSWVFAVRDTTDGTQVVLGSVGLGGPHDMTAAGWSGTEQGDCSAAPVSQALFGPPRTSAGAAAFVEASTRTSCPGSAVRVTDEGARVVTGPPTSGTETPTPLELPTSAPQPTVPTPVEVRTSVPQPVSASPSTVPSPSSTQTAVALPRASVSGTSTSGPTPVAAAHETSGRELPWWLPLLLLPVVLLPVRRRSGHP